MLWTTFGNLFAALMRLPYVVRLPVIRKVFLPRCHPNGLSWNFSCGSWLVRCLCLSGTALFQGIRAELCAKERRLAKRLLGLQSVRGFWLYKPLISKPLKLFSWLDDGTGSVCSWEEVDCTSEAAVCLVCLKCRVYRIPLVHKLLHQRRRLCARAQLGSLERSILL